MKKKQTSKTDRKDSFVSRKTFILTITGCLLISVLISLSSVFALYTYLITREDTSSVSKIAYMIQSAVNGLNREVPVASYSNVFFINDAKLTFTQSDNVKLVYRYEPSYEGSTDFILLSDQNIINDASVQMMNQPKLEAILEKVPLLQACSRLYAITFSDKGPEYSDYELVQSKQLKDGRTAYIWRTTELACNSTDFFEEHLTEVILSVDSY